MSSDPGIKKLTFGVLIQKHNLDKLPKDVLSRTVKKYALTKSPLPNKLNKVWPINKRTILTDFLSNKIFC